MLLFWEGSQYQSADVKLHFVPAVAFRLCSRAEPFNANCCSCFIWNDSQTMLNLLKWQAINQSLSKLYWTACNQITSIYTNVHLGKNIGYEYLKLLIFRITDVFILIPKCVCVFACFCVISVFKDFSSSSVEHCKFK